LKEIVQEILAMRGLISEPARSTIARRFAVMLTKGVTDRSPESIQQWLHKGVYQFLKACEVDDIPEGWVPNRLEVETTPLANFCNRWLHVESFRTSGEELWQPITPDMNSLRVTMIEELKTLAEGQANHDD